MNDAVAAVIPAAGAGLRMGGTRKQYRELAGEPVLLRAVRPFLEHPGIRHVVVVLPAGDADAPPAFLPPEVRTVAGGEERGDSVRLGLEALPPEVDLVVIHDAARPLVTRAIIDRAMEAARGGRGAIAAVPLTDTLKRVDPDGRIQATVDRTGLWRAQTPQAFPRAMIADAHARAAREGVRATDDAALVERYGGSVVVVEGAAANLKVTTSDDLRLAAALLARVSRGA